MDNGWISLHRKFLTWEWFEDEKMVKLFIYILLSANHKDGKWRGIEVKRGQLITGLNSLSSELKMSIKVVRNRLEKLKKTGELVIQTGNQYSIITICKYDSYQNEDSRKGNQTGKRRASDGQTEGKQRATNNNDNNDNNEKNENNNIENEINLYYLKNEKFLKKAIGLIKAEQLEITEDDLLQKAELFISQREIELDTQKQFAEYASHFINKVKKDLKLGKKQGFKYYDEGAENLKKIQEKYLNNGFE